MLMSAILLKTDITERDRHVRFVPKAEVAVIRSVELIVQPDAHDCAPRDPSNWCGTCLLRDDGCGRFAAPRSSPKAIVQAHKRGLNLLLNIKCMGAAPVSKKNSGSV